MRKLLAPLAVTALLLAGCSGGAEAGPEPTETVTVTPEPEPSADSGQSQAEWMEENPSTGMPEPESTGPGTYELLTTTGAKVILEIPADPPTDIDAFREATHIDPVMYVTAAVDNRDGAESVDISNVTLYDAAGKIYEFTSASMVLGDWGPTYTDDYEYVFNDGTTITESEGDALYNTGIDLYNENLNGVDPLAQREQVLIGEFESLPKEFTGVSVNATGYDEPAYPEGTSPVIDVAVPGAVGSDEFYLELYRVGLEQMPEGPFEQIGTDEEVIALGHTVCADLEVMTYDEVVANYSFQEGNGEAEVAHFMSAVASAWGAFCPDLG